MKVLPAPEVCRSWAIHSGTWVSASVPSNRHNVTLSATLEAIANSCPRCQARTDGASQVGHAAALAVGAVTWLRDEEAAPV
jgi:hypothetical protein